MAYSVDWAAKVILVPRADMALIQASPEVRALDLDVLRLTLRAIEASEEGIVFPQESANPSGLVKHTAPFQAGSTTFARVVELINGFTVEFEDGLYTVEIVNGNSNLGQGVVRNQVSVATNNSGGLVQTATSGLTSAESAALFDIMYRLGLGQGDPITFTPQQITCGRFTLTIMGDGVTSSTVTRQ